jgi:hypothetical protein
VSFDGQRATRYEKRKLANYRTSVNGGPLNGRTKRLRGTST